MMKCPVCDNEVKTLRGITIKSGYLICDRGSIRLGPVPMTILNALIRGPAEIGTLIELVYSNINTSPEKPAACIHVQICRLRPRLLDLGWRITTLGHHGIGEAYRLERAT